MKTYEIVRELVHMMDDNQPKQKEILWPAFTKMFDLMVEEYEERQKTAKVKKAKDAAEPKTSKESAKPKKKIDWPKAEACRKAGWDFTQIADELGISYNTVYTHFRVKEGTK